MALQTVRSDRRVFSGIISGQPHKDLREYALLDPVLRTAVEELVRVALPGCAPAQVFDINVYSPVKNVPIFGSQLAAGLRAIGLETRLLRASQPELIPHLTARFFYQ